MHRFFVTLAATCFASTAAADFVVCNESGYDVSVAIGYSSGGQWVSEGWWNAANDECVTPISGALQLQYYYLRVTSNDVDFPMENHTFCTVSDAFTITGDLNCEARGFQTSTFVEVDTGDATEYVFPLYSIDNNDQAALDDAYETAALQIYDALQGEWAHPEVPGFSTIVDGARMFDWLDGRDTGINATWTLADTCAGARGAGPVLIVVYEGAEDEPLCWVIKTLNDREFRFSAVNVDKDVVWRKAR